MIYNVFLIIDVIVYISIFDISRIKADLPHSVPSRTTSGSHSASGARTTG